MSLRKIIKLFDKGNVMVCGLRGDGKDMLMSNVVQRRKKPYISNADYGGVRFPFNPKEFDCAQNTYREFIDGDLYPYVYPYPDGTDIYISDAGVYFPAQYCSELNRDYGFFSSFVALSRHLGECNIHMNAQALNRIWDKFREQSDQYIMCKSCKVFFGKIVFQRVIIYEKYESALGHVPPFPLRKPLLNPDRRFQWKMQKANYLITHGKIEPHTLIYFHKSNYDTRVFKEMLKNGTKIHEEKKSQKRH